MDQEKIGRFIQSCRKEAGLTQAALAEKLGITDRAVSKWEHGKSMPDVSIMMELCSMLHINVNELLSGEHLGIQFKLTAKSAFRQHSRLVQIKFLIRFQAAFSMPGGPVLIARTGKRTAKVFAATVLSHSEASLGPPSTPEIRRSA